MKKDKIQNVYHKQKKVHKAKKIVAGGIVAVLGVVNLKKMRKVAVKQGLPLAKIILKKII